MQKVRPLLSTGYKDRMKYVELENSDETNRKNSQIQKANADRNRIAGNLHQEAMYYSAK